MEYDYNKLRDETTVKAIADVYKILGTYSERLSFKVETKKEEIEAVQAEVVQEMLNVIIENKVPQTDVKFIGESITSVMYMLFSLLARQLRELETEYLARSIGARDPGTNKFSNEYATVGEFFTALQGKREEQDVEGNQYFITEPTKEEFLPEA